MGLKPLTKIQDPDVSLNKRRKLSKAAKGRMAGEHGEKMRAAAHTPEAQSKHNGAVSLTMRANMVDVEKERPDQFKQRITPNKIELIQRDIWENGQEWIDKLWGSERVNDPGHVPFKPWHKQIEILESVQRHNLTVAHSGNGVGKTKIVSAISILFLMGHMPSTVFTTSSGWRELEKVLWPEIRNLFYTSALPLGAEPKTVEWLPGKKGARHTDRWRMVAVAAKDKNNFAGFHNRRVLGVGDEADGIEAEVLQAMFGNATGEHDRLLLTGNPHTPGSAFHKATLSSEWNSIHVPCWEHPNVVSGREIFPGMVTTRWIDLMREELGEGTPAWQSRVEGVFPEHDSLAVVPYSWIVAATKRAEPSEMNRDTAVLAVDVARSETGDLTVFLLRDDQGVWYMEAFRGASTMQTAGRIMLLAEQFEPTVISVDDVGVGGGVVDRLMEHFASGELKKLGVKRLEGVGFGERAADHKKFFNRRAECYWKTRELLDPEKGCDFYIPPQYLNRLSEMSVCRIEPHSSGKIKMESKEKIKERLKRSPDFADTLALSCDVGSNPVNVQIVKTIDLREISPAFI